MPPKRRQQQLSMPISEAGLAHGKHASLGPVGAATERPSGGSAAVAKSHRPGRRPSRRDRTQTAPTAPHPTAPGGAGGERRGTQGGVGAGQRHVGKSFQSAAIAGQGAAAANRTLGPRAMVIEELVLTENDYARDLEILLRHFLVPIQKMLRKDAKESQKILSAADVKTMFCNFTELLDIAYGVMNQLEQLKRQRATGRKYRVGDVLSIMANEFKAYTVYCINFPAATELVMTLRKAAAEKVSLGKGDVSNPANFVQFEADAFANPETQHIDILGYLIKPVQRITKYPLLMSELLKHTPETHAEYKMLQKAHSRMEAVARYINERKAAYEQRRLLEVLSQRIDKLDADLARSGRTVALEFNAKVSMKRGKTPKDLHHFWVFSDIMLVCKTKAGGVSARAGNHFAKDDPEADKYKFLARVSLNKLHIDLESAVGIKNGHLFSMVQEGPVSSSRKGETFISVAFADASTRDKVFETLVTTVEQLRALELVKQQEMYTWENVEGDGELCVALYDYVSCGLHADTELEFGKGDLIRVLAKAVSGGLWKGSQEGGQIIGVFPREFVEPVDENDGHIEFEEADEDGQAPPRTGTDREEDGTISQTITAAAPIPAAIVRPRGKLKSKLVTASTMRSKQLYEEEVPDSAAPAIVSARSEVDEPASPAPAAGGFVLFPPPIPAIPPDDPTFDQRPEFPESPKNFVGVGVADDPNTKHRETMEDDWVVVDEMGLTLPWTASKAICELATEQPADLQGDVSMLAVFDGHGGAETAQFLGRNFHEILQHHLRKQAFDLASAGSEMWTEKDLDQALCRAFMSADDAYLDLENDAPGATAAVALVCNAKNSRRPDDPPSRWLVAANIGDARVVVCTGDGQTHRLTYDHKATDEAEASRVNNETDGFIINQRVGGYLAITRAFGDRPLKAYGVVADPHVQSLSIPRGDSAQRPFVIVACDGIWDVMEDREAVELVKEMAQEGTPTAAQWMADKLVSTSLEKGTDDNVTALVALL
jgi:serine/threonine protein phosphatase PrpC